MATLLFAPQPLAYARGSVRRRFGAANVRERMRNYLCRSVYFAGGLLMDRGSRFFPSGVPVLLSDSIGRCRQIFSLTVISSVLSFWKRWYSSISDCAFRQAAGEGNDSATVFPSTLRVSRIWGSCPGSLGLAQWQVGFPQRRGTAQIEPVRRSLRVVNRRRILERSASNSGREFGIGAAS